jgi:hypothetical protein
MDKMENYNLECVFNKRTLSEYKGQTSIGFTKYNFKVVILKGDTKYSININIKDMKEGIYKNKCIQEIKTYIINNIINNIMVKTIDCKIEEKSIFNNEVYCGRRVFVF